MIKVIPTRNLAPCPICGSKVELRRNSGKRFQIKCTNPTCYVRTAWLSKTLTLCTWSEICARLGYSYHDEKGQKLLNDNLQSPESIYRGRNEREIQ